MTVLFLCRLHHLFHCLVSLEALTFCDRILQLPVLSSYVNRLCGALMPFSSLLCFFQQSSRSLVPAPWLFMLGSHEFSLSPIFLFALSHWPSMLPCFSSALQPVYHLLLSTAYFSGDFGLWVPPLVLLLFRLVLFCPPVNLQSYWLVSQVVQPSLTLLCLLISVTLLSLVQLS